MRWIRRLIEALSPERVLSVDDSDLYTRSTRINTTRAMYYGNRTCWWRVVPGRDGKLDLARCGTGTEAWLSDVEETHRRSKEQP